VCVHPCRHGHTFLEHSAGDDRHRQMSLSAVGNIQFAKDPPLPSSWHCICALTWCTLPSLPLPVAVCSSCQALNWSSLVALHTLWYCMIWLCCMIACLSKVHRLGHWSPHSRNPPQLGRGGAANRLKGCLEVWQCRGKCKCGCADGVAATARR
jgi:hypothetical protein